MSHGNGGVSSNFAAHGNTGTFTGGNNMNAPANTGGTRMGRIDHDHDHDHDGRFRFRGRNFAFGFYPGYNYSYSDYDYDPGCYQLRQVHTRYGWRWQQVWVCSYY
jgi:hypothetical protein